MKKLSSTILVIVGSLLLYWGYEEYNSFSSQVSELFQGTPPIKTLAIMIAGGVSLLVGLIQIIKK
ncbi:MAG: DUF3185 family protein [Gammaproteobacteria bacterium]|nr:DUF3185 family protein [Gammaproteobacteria bacterium]